MEDFKILTEDELEALSNKERREYLKKKKEYENTKMVNDIAGQPKEEVPEVIVTPIISVPAPKKSNAGRKAIADSEKKQQIMLTIEADSKNRLEALDSKNYKKLLGRYIDKNINSIIEALEQL